MRNLMVHLNFLLSAAHRPRGERFLTDAHHSNHKARCIDDSRRLLDLQIHCAGATSCRSVHGN